MKVAELLEKRRAHWQELEVLCESLQNRRKKFIPYATLVRFDTLYRAACADLALADSYQLPPNTVQFLHRLVARAHNQLYRSRRFDIATWTRVLLVSVPQQIFRDRCVQLTFAVFWGVFILSAVLANSSEAFPEYAESILTRDGIRQLEENFSQPLADRPLHVNQLMAAFYIWHNTTIGLKCFAGGLLVVPGVFVFLFNAAYLGASFGYMARPDVEASDNFFQFVTAHGPFELTAIVLSAGAGLRLGLAILQTKGFTREASLGKIAYDVMPVIGTAMVLFFGAALIEGFLSPSSLPYWLKATVAVLCSGLLMFYFVVLGFPRR